MAEVIAKEVEYKIETEEISRTKVIDNEIFDTVVVKNYWDSHGKEIPWEDENGKKSNTFKNAKVLLEKVVKVMHFKYSGDTKFEWYVLTINGNKYTGEITSCKGTKERLVLKACIGAG